MTYFLQVHDSGVISFRSPYNFQDPLVTPLVSGFPAEVFYRSTNDSNTLEHVMEFISAANPDQSTYQPAFAVIVTWNHLILTDVVGSPEVVCSLSVTIFNDHKNQ